MEDGKLVTTKLPKESVYEERVVGNIFRTRIALPNVKVGTIIELEYTILGLPYSIEIQRYIPVNYSIVILPKHQIVDYTIKEFGALGPVYNRDNVWIYKNLPAFVTEPYLISNNDYRVMMEIDVIKYYYSNNYFYAMGFFASTWGDVIRYFINNDYLGRKFKDFNTHLNSLADSIKGVTNNEEERIKLAFDAIKRIKWNGQEACYLSQDLSQTFKLRSGNSADINTSLVVLLRKLGLNAYPVVLSTRENGKITKLSPTIGKFNYLIAEVDFTMDKWVLDATEEFAPYYLLPDRIMGCLGLPIDETKVECNPPIEPTKMNKMSSTSEFVIDSSGKISGKIKITRDDYNALDFKRLLQSKTDHDSYIQELEALYQGWYIDKFNFENFNDPYKPFNSEYEVHLSSISGNSDFVNINPFVFVKPTYNPFVREQRRFPISYPQPIEHSYTITLIIPENFKFAETPKPTELLNKDKSIRFAYQAQKQGDRITVNAKFTVSKLQYEAYNYKYIREIYDLMMQKLNETIIIKKV
jgi:hypothetical protein